MELKLDGTKKKLSIEFLYLKRWLYGVWRGIYVRVQKMPKHVTGEKRYSQICIKQKHT